MLAAVAIVAVVLNVFFGFAVSVLAAAIAFMCVYELYRCVEVPVKGIFFVYAEIFTVAVVLSFVPMYSDLIFKLQIILTVAFIVITAANGLASRDGFRKTILLSLITLLIVITFSIIAMWGLRTVYSGSGRYNITSLAMFVVTVLAPFASDTSGLLVGIKFGKHKMAPRISPKKTWEGFIGSCIGAPIIMMVLGLIFEGICSIFELPYEANHIALLLTGLIGAVLGTAGDLFFSIIKRKMGVKDYGSIMPGHGGMLDRFDSFVFTTPAIFILYSLYPQFHIDYSTLAAVAICY